MEDTTQTDACSGEKLAQKWGTADHDAATVTGSNATKASQDERRDRKRGQAHARRLLDTHGVEREYGPRAGYLNKLRCSGEGPPFLKLGKRVLYDPLDVEAWLATKRRMSTSDTGEIADQKGKAPDQSWARSKR